jgi:subtilase family serine protease
MQKRRGRFFLSTLACGGVLVLLVGMVFGSTLLAKRGAHAASSVSGNPQKMQISVNPMDPMKTMGVPMNTNGTTTLPCLTSTTLPRCYNPLQIRTAYEMQPLLNANITGEGRIITIIDAFQDPTVRQDLQIFDGLFGLNDPRLNILAPFGLTPFNPNDPAQTGFAGEIALDVEWAHAIAPGATIDLVLGNVKQETAQGELTALLQATSFAVNKNIGSVISQSFGVGETCLTPAFVQSAHKVFQQALVNKQTVFASAGDTGAGVLQCDAQGMPITIAQGVNYPASDPLVTSVGGTTLMAGLNGTYMSETAWNESLQGAGATGGGVSKLFAHPAFQNNVVNSKMRGVSDIALDGDPLTGVPIVTSSVMPGKTLLMPVGGTSVGSPVAAGMTALFDQAAGGKRLGFLNSALYRIGLNVTANTLAFHDIQVGNNAFVFQTGNGNIVTVPGFQTATGWDPPTGLGTPNAVNMAKLLPQFIQAKDGKHL